MKQITYQLVVNITSAITLLLLLHLILSKTCDIYRKRKQHLRFNKQKQAAQQKQSTHPVASSSSTQSTEISSLRSTFIDFESRLFARSKLSREGEFCYLSIYLSHLLKAMVGEEAFSFLEHESLDDVGRSTDLCIFNHEAVQN